MHNQENDLFYSSYTVTQNKPVSAVDGDNNFNGVVEYVIDVGVDEVVFVDSIVMNVSAQLGITGPTDENNTNYNGVATCCNINTLAAVPAADTTCMIGAIAPNGFINCFYKAQFYCNGEIIHDIVNFQQSHAIVQNFAKSWVNKDKNLNVNSWYDYEQGSLACLYSTPATTLCYPSTENVLYTPTFLNNTLNNLSVYMPANRISNARVPSWYRESDASRVLNMSIKQGLDQINELPLCIKLNEVFPMLNHESKLYYGQYRVRLFIDPNYRQNLLNVIIGQYKEPTQANLDTPAVNTSTFKPAYWQFRGPVTSGENAETVNYVSFNTMQSTITGGVAKTYNVGISLTDNYLYYNVSKMGGGHIMRDISTLVFPSYAVSIYTVPSSNNSIAFNMPLRKGTQMVYLAMQINNSNYLNDTTNMFNSISEFVNKSPYGPTATPSTLTINQVRLTFANNVYPGVPFNAISTSLSGSPATPAPNATGGAKSIVNLGDGSVRMYNELYRAPRFPYSNDAQPFPTFLNKLMWAFTFEQDISECMNCEVYIQSANNTMILTNTSVYCISIYDQTVEIDYGQGDKSPHTITNILL